MITFHDSRLQSAQMIGPDIPIISTHQIPTYEEVLNFAYQIYQKAKDQDQLLREQDQILKDCQSIIQQQKDDIKHLSDLDTVWRESFAELEESYSDLEAENKELRTRAMGKALEQATEWVQDAANRDAENFVLKQQVGERDQTIIELRNRLKQDASASSWDQEQRITELEAETTELREQVANKDQIIERNHKEHDAEIMRMQATIDRLDNDLTHEKQEWATFYALCENEDLESSEKLYMWQCRRYVLSLRDTIIEPVHACLEVMGSKIGMKRDAPRRIMRNLNERCPEPLFFIDSEKKVKENGEMKTNVTMRLASIMQNPADVHKVNGKEHGGKPDRKCPKTDCQSENIDQFRLQHCRDCDDVGLYKLPGTRADFDMIGAMNAVAKESPIYKKLQEQFEHLQAQKQDALTCQCHHEVGERDTEETPAIAVAKPKLVLIKTQKQDASEDFEQDEDNLQRNNTYIDNAASCMKNPATCACCEGVDMDYAPLHRCYSCGATSYEWNHMRRRWLCSWCGATPALC